MFKSNWKNNPRFIIDLVLVFFLIIFFTVLYWHDSTQGTYQLIDYRQGTYFKALALQFEKGQLGLSEMIGGDWLKYNDRYYLYFAPLPALIWLVLKHIGIITSFSALTLIASTINLILFYLLLVQLRLLIKFDEKVAFPLRIIGLLLYAFGPLYFLASRYFIYETAIVFGSTLLLLAVHIYILYFVATKITLVKKSGLVLACGIVMAAVFLSRLNLILMIFPFLAGICWKEYFISSDKAELKVLRSWLLISILLVPVIISAWGITLYNTARFGNPTEFGIRYSIIGSDHGDVAERVRSNKMTSPSFLMLNTIQLAILRPFWTSTPAHISYNNRPSWLIGPYPKLADDEYVSSLFFSSPLLLCAFYLLYAYKKHKESRSVILLLLASTIASYIYAASSMAYARRYIQDYYPFAILLTYLGMYFLWTDIISRLRALSQTIVITLIIVILAVTAGIGVNLNCQVAFTQDFQRCFNFYNAPSTFEPLSKLIFTLESGTIHKNI